MPYKELIKCPQCGNPLTTVKKPRNGTIGEKYCNNCIETYPFDVWTGEPITNKPKKPYKPKKMITGQVCEYCGKTFEAPRKRATCPDNDNRCAKMLAGRKARDSRLRKQAGWRK